MVFKKDKSSSSKIEKSEKRSALPIKVISQSPRSEDNENTKKNARRSTASPSRRSPSRKSPSRKSPSRKSPSRKSPSRGQKSPSTPTKSPVFKVSGRKSVGERRSPSRATKPILSKTKKTIVDTDTDSDTAEISAKLSVEKPKAAVRGRARNVETEQQQQPIKGMVEIVTTVENEGDSNLVRRSARISQQREVERIVHVKQDLFNQKASEFSDDDDILNLTYSNQDKATLFKSFEPPRSMSIDRKSEPKKYESKKSYDRLEKYEFGGTFGALALIFLIPLSVLGLNVFCTKNSCSFSKVPNFAEFKKIATYYDEMAWLVYISFALCLFALNALPFGGRKICGLLNKEGILEYRMNGLFSGVVLSVLTVGLCYKGYPLVQIVTERYFQLLIASLLFGTLLTIALSIKSRYAPVSALNPHAVTRSRIYNFWMGYELNPRFFGVIDVKMYLYRFVIISSLLINGLFLYKKLLPSKLSLDTPIMQQLNLAPTPILLASLQGLYFLDGLLFESSWVTSFEIQYEGVGWMLALGYTSYPFMATTLLKYVTEHNIELPLYQLVFATIVFLVGYFLLRASNAQKDSFRKNPYDPSLSHLETIPTIQGKRLLVSGYWGFVRHPNYLGDILIQLSLIFFVKITPPLIFCLVDILFLVARAYRDGRRCKERYGAAWDIYCQRVKYIIVPKVY